ncbi:acyltransferase [Enterobacter sp.]|uniref:acyltransferase n=1 Tax=Enterobacter sp. TaxID=42895 RepID=UPI00296E8344|nr:acyltransferase [Enterobacter sp.]
MLYYKMSRLIARMLFFVKFIFLKIALNKKIKFPKFYLSCIDSDFKIWCLNGTLTFSGRFISRRFLTINVMSGELVVGKDVFFNQNVSINCQNNIIIGNNSIFGESVKLYDHNHRFNLQGNIKDQGFISKPIVIGDNVWIGSNSVILSGVEIGNNSVISAGSIVRCSIPADSIYKDGNVIKILRRED